MASPTVALTFLVFIPTCILLGSPQGTQSPPIRGQNIANSTFRPDLEQELSAMNERAKEARAGWSRSGQTNWDSIQSIDKANEKRLLEIIQESGWPSTTTAGRKGVIAAFGIVQHGSATLRKICLPFIKVAYERGELLGEHLALITDRILAVDEGKRQLYGTQFRQTENNGLEPCPIEDEANLDSRRKQLSMIPFSEYKARVLSH